jgi:RNA polymerase sigma factor (sigma-70 family)
MDEPDRAPLPLPDLSAPGHGADAEQAHRDAEFADFYLSATPRLVAFLVTLGARPVDAADIAQEAIIEAHRRWSTLTYRQAWIRRVASRLWGRRMARAHEEPVDEIGEHTSLLRSGSDIDAVIERYDIHRLLQSLPLRQRQVLAWTLDGFTGPEIADELGITADAVRQNLVRARRTLASRLTEEGGQS